MTSERIEQQQQDMAASTARFTGTLAELGTADLIQLLQLVGKDAWITIQQPELESRLWCRAGALIDAESGRLRGEAAAYRILGFDDGLLSAELRPVERAAQIDVGTPCLLLEAARRKDECVQLEARLGGPRRCYRCEGSPLATPELEAQEQALLQSFGDGRSLTEVLAESELGDWEALQAITRWRDAGVLVDAGVSEAPARAEASFPKAERHDPSEHSSTAPVEVEPSAARVGAPRPLPPWSYAALGALALLGSGYAAGTRVAQSRAAALSSSPVAAVAPLVRRPESFALELQVEPASAEIVLDGSHIATGSFTTRLPRDGSPHELRVSAPGFLAAHIWFVDAAPPKQLLLEALPAAAGDPGSTPESAEAKAHNSSPATRVRKALRGELNEPSEASPSAGTRRELLDRVGLGAGAPSGPARVSKPAAPVVRVIE